MKHSNNLLTMEKRNIAISLERARDWYNRGGEYKELALSAFNEEEITESALPNTWKEFCEMYPIKEDKKEWYIDIDSTPRYTYKSLRYYENCKNVLPSLQAAQQHLAYMQLHQLRDCYRQGWKPDWSNSNQCKWSIMFDTDTFIVQLGFFYNHFLSFQSENIAKKFLNNFKNLIETAGDLI